MTERVPLFNSRDGVGKLEHSIDDLKERVPFFNSRDGPVLDIISLSKARGDSRYQGPRVHRIVKFKERKKSTWKYIPCSLCARISF